MPGNLNDTYIIKQYMVRIAPFNFYNPIQRILRIEYGDADSLKYFDFYNTDDARQPNPLTTYAILETYESVLSSETYAIRSDDVRYNLLPGYIREKELDLTMMPFGFIRKIIPKSATIDVSAPDGDAGFFLKGMDNPSNPSNVQISLQSSIPETYTKTRESMEYNPSYDAFGLTVGSNFTTVKGPDGGGITMGPNGKIVLSGDIHTTKSKWTQGFMQDNPLGEWVPPTIVTVAPAMLKIPFNMDAIASFATMAQRVAKGIESVGTISSIVNSFNKR